MRLAALSLKNYRRFRDAEIEFPDGLVGIVGQNGAGKSSLMEAVAWALFGNEKSIVRTDRESVKRLGSAVSDPCSAVLEFEFERSNYRIERTMKGKNLSMSATMEVDGKMMANGAGEVSDLVSRTLGMDYKSFFISVFAKQKELNALTVLNPAERRREILRMLGIEDIDAAIKAIRTDARQLITAVKGAQEEIYDEEGRPAFIAIEKGLLEKRKELKLRDKELASMEKRLEKSEKDYDKLKASVREKEAAFKEMNRLQKKLASLDAGVEELRKRRAELVDEMAGASELEKRHTEARPKAEKAEAELKSVLKKREGALKDRDNILAGKSEDKTEIKRLKKEISGTEKELTKVKEMGPESKCPTCRRKMDDAYGKLVKLFEGQMSEMEKKLVALEERLEARDSSMKECEARVAALRKREERLRKRLEDWEVLKARMEKIALWRKKLKEAESRLEEKEKEMRALGKELDKLDFDEKVFRKEREKLDEQAMELRRCERLLGEMKLKGGSLESEIKGAEKEVERLKKIESRLAEKMERMKLLNELEEVMKDFKGHMISRIRPTLSQSSSRLMGQLTDNRYNEITLDADYDISMADGGVYHPIDRFSGGEKDLANLCLRLAISRVIAERAGSSGFNFIVLDEIFGSQDVGRRRNIFEALNGLGNRFKQMFLITHMEEVKDMMASVIVVKPVEDGTSTAEVLA